MCIVPSLEVVRILKKGSPALVFVSLSFMKIWTYSYYLPPAHEAETPSPVLHSLNMLEVPPLPVTPPVTPGRAEIPSLICAVR